MLDGPGSGICLQFCFPLKTEWIGYENLYRIPPGLISVLNVQFWFSILKIHIILFMLGEVGELAFIESKF